MDPTRMSTKVRVKKYCLCQGETEYYCFGCQRDMCIQNKKFHVELSSKHYTVTSYVDKMKYPPKQVKSSQSQNPSQMTNARS